MAIQEPSDYEKQRQANIAERDRLLKDLKLQSAGAAVAPKRSARARPNAPKNKKPAPRKARIEVVPSRKSSRLAGIEADSEVAKRKAEEEYEVAQEVARVKRQRRSGDLDLKDIVVKGNGWSNNSNAFASLDNRGAMPYERTFGETEIKKTSNKELQSLQKTMSGLKIYETFEPSRIKITPERIYAMAFHPEPTKPLIFAGDKMGHLGVFDASQSAEQIKNEDDDDEDEDGPDPQIDTFKVHTRTITAFQVSPKNSSQILTSSYDSSIRQMDLVTGTATEIYGPEDREADEPISGLEIDPRQPQILYFSRLDGHIGRHDTRENPSNATKIWEFSEKKIGGFSIHPQYPHYLATASLDRTMCLWDLRKLAKPTKIGEHTSRLSVSHAAFNSVGQIATSSYDDTIKIYNFENMGTWKPGAKLSDDQTEPAHVVKHNNQTGRWVTILRPQWQRQPEDGVQRFVIGNMNRFVDVYSGSGDQLAQLGGDGITAVPAVAQFHPTKLWIAAGTASGKLCLWM